MEKAPKALVMANVCLWLYFWAAFAHSSYPFRPDPLGHPAGTGYTFWGHSIAVVESALVYPFFRAIFYAGFPSFALATFIAQALSPNLLLNSFLWGISGGGWLLLAVMVLTVLQWYLIGYVVRKLWRKWFGPETGIRSEAPTSGPIPPATYRL